MACPPLCRPRHLEGPLEENWLQREGSEDFARLVDYVDQYRSARGASTSAAIGVRADHQRRPRAGHDPGLDDSGVSTRSARSPAIEEAARDKGLATTSDPMPAHSACSAAGGGAVPRRSSRQRPGRPAAPWSRRTCTLPSADCLRLIGAPRDRRPGLYEISAAASARAHRQFVREGAVADGRCRWRRCRTRAALRATP